MEHFKLTELLPPKKILGLWTWTCRENAVREINNLFASRPIGDINQADIEAVAARYGFNPLKKYHARFVEMFETWLQGHLENDLMTEADVEVANKIASLLGVEDKEASAIYNRLTGEKVKTKFYQICNDRRISPDELEEFNVLCKNLRTTFDSDGIIERFTKCWELENRPLPEIEADLNLSKNETCYFVRHGVEWYEYRSRTTRVDYGGLTGRIRICKGVSYRWGSMSPTMARTNELALIKSGSLYLTNKNLIFVGEYQNSTIPLSKILSFEPYSDGVAINKQTGKSPLLMLPDAEEMSVILERLINEN
jgi:hypothetical protein